MKIDTYFLLGGLLLLLPACTLSSSPGKSVNLEGIWQEEGKTCQNNCGTIEFFRDGRFEAHNLPDNCFGYVQSFDISSRFDASGLWTLTESEELWVQDELDLRFDTYVGENPVTYHRTVYLADKKIFCWVGDESNQVIFKRQPSTETP